MKNFLILLCTVKVFFSETDFLLCKRRGHVAPPFASLVLWQGYFRACMSYHSNVKPIVRRNTLSVHWWWHISLCGLLTSGTAMFCRFSSRQTPTNQNIIQQDVSLINLFMWIVILDNCPSSVDSLEVDLFLFLSKWSCSPLNELLIF